MKGQAQAKFFIFALILAFQFITVMRANGQELNVNGLFSVDRATRGRLIQAALVTDIPKGWYVNANKSLSKFITPAVIKVDAESGIKIGPATFPRAKVRTFTFSRSQLAMYDGRLIIRFNLTIPPNFATGATTIRVRFQYQSCTDQACSPPRTREIQMPIMVVNDNEPVKRINGHVFANGR